MHVNETLLAGGAGESAKRLLAEHGVLFVFAAALAHDEVVQVLELFLVDLERLAGVRLVSKLFGQRFHDVAQSVLERLVHLREVRLLVQRVLHLFHPLRELVPQVVQRVFQVRNSLSKSIECFLTDTIAATGGLGDFEVCKGAL